MQRVLSRALIFLITAALLLPFLPIGSAAMAEPGSAQGDLPCALRSLPLREEAEAGGDPLPARSVSGFTDIKGHWAWAWIELAYRRGLVSGVTATQFAPNHALSRAMFVTLLYSAAGKPDVSLTTVDAHGNTVRKRYFSDVAEGKWYEAPVIWAYETGLTAGTEPGRFSPNQPTTREQMCVFLVRFADYQGKDLNPQLPQSVFADDAQISSWAKSSVYLLQRCGLISGVGGGLFAPKRAMTRAEATALLMSYLRATGQLPPTQNLVNPARTIDYAQMVSDLTDLAIEYPGLIRLSSAGTSVEGRDIPLVYFGKGSKYIYTQANIHAREHQTTNYVLEILDVYAYAYETGASFDAYNVRNLLDAFTLVILPRVNPDGTNVAQKGFDAAQNPAALWAMSGANKGAGNWKANTRGVDLNRNFPCYWRTIVDAPASEAYGGPYAASEPETQAVISAMQKYSYVCYLDIHMAGQVIYFCNPGIDDAFFNASKAFAQVLSGKTGYSLGNSDNIRYDHSAAAYARNQFLHPALTVELTASTVFPHDSTKFYTEIWPYVKDLYLAAMTYYK